MKSVLNLRGKCKMVQSTTVYNQQTFCKFDLTNVSPDGVLFTDSGGRLSLRASSGVTFKNSKHVISPNAVLGIELS